MRESFIYIYVNKRNEKGIHERSLGMEKLLLPRFGIVCKYLFEVFEYQFVCIWVVNVVPTTAFRNCYSTSNEQTSLSKPKK